MEHIISCQMGGFPTIRHNKIRDVTATLLSEVCHDVAVEPHLQSLEGETFYATANSQDGARLDIVASGFWGGRFERSFYDVRVFNPHTPSNQHPQMESTYRRHEALKRRTYEQRVREVEHASFTPLVMSLTGSLGPAASTTCKRLGSLLSAKWDQPYSHIMAWLRCGLSFSLLRSSIMCIRGARSSRGHAASCPAVSVDIICREAQVSAEPFTLVLPASLHVSPCSLVCIYLFLLCKKNMYRVHYYIYLYRVCYYIYLYRVCYYVYLYRVH